MTPPDAAPVLLWQVGAWRCLLTPATVPPPYLVIIYNGEHTELSEAFADHHAATTFAVHALGSVPSAPR